MKSIVSSLLLMGDIDLLHLHPLSIPVCLINSMMRSDLGPSRNIPNLILKDIAPVTQEISGSMWPRDVSYLSDML